MPDNDKLVERLTAFQNALPRPWDKERELVGSAIEALQSERSSMEGEIEALKDHIFSQAEFAEYRIKDGDEMGGLVWRIALEDIVKENRTVLNRSAKP